jgi:hypothetical protein
MSVSVAVSLHYYRIKIKITKNNLMRCVGGKGGGGGGGGAALPHGSASA